MIDAGQWLAGITDRWHCRPVAESPSVAINLIAERHGLAGQRFGQLASDPAASRSELFAAKNASLELSLDAAMLWSGDLYRQQLPLIAGAVGRLRPNSIVDVGCEQGLITCLLAAAAPNSSVVGIDPCPHAIARAQELAFALDLQNVTFNCCDPLAADTNQGTFDLLIESRAMLGEALLACEDPPELLPGEISATAEWRTAANAAAKVLARLLKPDGHALLTERTDSSGVVRWTTALATAGFTTSGPHTPLSTNEPGGQATFRVLRAELAEASIAPQPQDLFAPAEIPGPGYALHGEAAESAALHLRPMNDPTAWEWINSNQDRERIELVVSIEGNLVELRCSTNGERTLCVHSGSDEAEVHERTERFVNASAGAKIGAVSSILPYARGKIES